MFDAAAYLDRIGYSGPTEPTAATLAALHRAHMETVPFENLDIHLGVRNVLDADHVFDKVVVRRRGGSVVGEEAAALTLVPAPLPHRFVSVRLG